MAAIFECLECGTQCADFINLVTHQKETDHDTFGPAMGPTPPMRVVIERHSISKKEYVDVMECGHWYHWSGERATRRAYRCTLCSMEGNDEPSIQPIDDEARTFVTQNEDYVAIQSRDGELQGETDPNGRPEVAKKAKKRSGASKAKNNCLCGCGTKCGKFFAPGHDARVKSKIKKGEDIPAEAMKYAKDNWSHLPIWGEEED